MSRRSTRRSFLKSSAAAVAALPAIFVAPAGKRFAWPSAKLNIAVVGAGGRGFDVTKYFGDENVVALCDVNEQVAAKAFAAFPKAAKYRDYRVLFDKQTDVEAVIVATPDHMHAPIALRAMNLGYHCYCEKPLTWSIGEARLMAETAARMRVATQMGNQGSSMDGFRRGVELLRAGVLGKVSEVHVWTNRPVWPQAIDRPEGEKEVPKHLDWDLWLGVAPSRPFHDGYQPFAWRGWYDFGTGALGDMACHTVNLPWRGLELGAPESVEAETTNLYAETFPAGSRISFRFPARGDQPPVTLVWYDGRMRPKADLAPASLVGEKLPGSGVLIIGSKGRMFSQDDYGTAQTWEPAELGKAEVPVSLPRVGGLHQAEWAAACKGGPKAWSDFSIAGPLTETFLLGNLALRTGKKIHWDAKTLSAKDLPETKELIHRPYRAGFAP